MTSVTTTSSGTSARTPALDALRAIMMLLGIVLHGIISYTTRHHGSAWPFSFGEEPVHASWPYLDPRGIYLFDVVYQFLHVFRMPLFFLLSGYFSRLVLDKKGARGLLQDRRRRILYPLLVFWPLLFPLVGAGMLFLMDGGKTASGPAFVNSGNFLSILSPLHLWFLYDLLFFNLFAVALHSGLNFLPQTQDRIRQRIRRTFTASVNHPLAVVIVALPHAILLSFFGGKILSTLTFIPDLRALAVYFLFFLFGWIFYSARVPLENIARRPFEHLALGALLFFVLISLRLPTSTSGIMAVSILNSLCVWSFIFAAWGIFLRYFGKPSKVLRYLSESSYWMYLIHLPVLVGGVVLLKHRDWPVLSKAVLLLILTFVILLGSYQSLVRKRLLGRFLRGNAKA